MGANEKHDAAYNGRDDKPEQEAPSRPELGRVGKAIMTVVSLAILVPFIAILWAWAAEVVRSFG